MTRINNNYCQIDTIYVTHLYFDTEEKAKRFVEFENSYNKNGSKILANRGRKYQYRGENRYDYEECPYEVTYNGDGYNVFEKFEHEDSLLNSKQMTAELNDEASYEEERA